MLVFLALVGLAVVAEAEDSRLPIPSEATLIKMLGGPDVIQVIRNAGRIETVRVRVDDPRGRNCAGQQIVEMGKHLDLSTELVE